MSASGKTSTASVLAAAFCEKAASSESSPLPQKPKRPSPLSLRLSADERTRLEREAGGMALGAYIKSRLFDGATPPTRSKRKSPLKDHAALARGLNFLRHSNLGASMQHISDAANDGRSRFTRDERKRIEQACADIATMRGAILEALGHPDMGG